MSITLYNDAPYGAIWDFQPLATGTAILLATIVTALVVRLPAGVFFAQIGNVWRQARIAKSERPERGVEMDVRRMDETEGQGRLQARVAESSRVAGWRHARGALARARQLCF